MRKPFLAVVMSLALAAPLAAQDVQATPQALARRVSEITSQHDWAALAQLIEPAQLERVQQTFGRLLELEADPQGFAIFGVSDMAAYNALSPRQVMTSFLAIAEQQQGLAEMEFPIATQLGVVHEAPDQAHVVIRQQVRIGDLDVSAPDLISMRRSDGRWWLQMGPELEGMLVGIESQLPPE